MSYGVGKAFEEQACKSQDKVAIIFKNRHLTYGFLNELANKLANYLRVSHSVKPGDVIGISLPRSTDFILAMLAVLKIGATYIAIDPKTPSKRIKYIIEDAQIFHVITSKSLINNLFDISISLFIEEINYSKFSSENLKISYPINPVAYVIYTSGTTGEPKGVLLGSLGIRNYVKQIANIFNKDENRIGYINSPYTDLGYTSLYTALLNGFTLCVLPEEQEFSLINLIDYLFLEKISIIKTTPSYYQLLSSEINALKEPKKEKILRYIKKVHFFVGGESLLSHYLTLKTKLTNHYGPTETTIGTTTYNIETNTLKQGNIPIGKSLKNTRVYILNDTMSIVPEGIQGEIYIGGLGVAFGYLNNPSLTAQNFLANPFCTKEEKLMGLNTRIYKTGDFAKYLPDGNIEFLGRKDEQVKINGYRIELKEIEAAINSHKDIKDCMVVTKEGLLIAYIIQGEFKVDAEELDLYLQEIIPNYMLPQYYINIDKIPLNNTGKRNKKGLPPFNKLVPQKLESYVKPTDSIEIELSEIWKEILKVEKVGRYDNFFKLGGHSLLAIKLISSINRKFNKEIRLIDLFDNPTIIGLKKLIVSADDIIASNNIRIPILSSRANSAALSFAQHRLFFLENLITDAVYNMHVAFELVGNLDRKALASAISDLVMRHESLKTVFKKDKLGNLRQIILKDVSIYEEIKIANESNIRDAIIKLKEKESNNKFDLEKGPLCRIKLLTISSNKHILILTKHHIISDGWSFNILYKELSEFYNFYKLNKKSISPKLPVRYIDYSIWQKKCFEGKQLLKQLDYWRNTLEDAPVNTCLPTDKIHPNKLTFQGGNTVLKFDLQLSNKIENICFNNNISPYIFFLTVLNVLVYKVTGNKDLIIGRLVNGRQHQEIENVIGLFVNTSVLRTKIKPPESFENLLLGVKKNLLESYQFQEVPFEKLINMLKIERNSYQNPLFQILIDYKDFNSNLSPDLDGIHIKDISANYDKVKFDLEFIAHKLKDSTLGVRINYLVDIYSHETIERFADFFKNIIKEAVEDIKLPISDINIISKKEQSGQIKLLNKNNSLNENIRPLLFNQLFTRNIRANPDRIAICDQGIFITFEELDQRSDYLSNCFYKAGLRRGDFIVYGGSRGLEAVIAMLAIFKLGATYVPVDPNTPGERINFILSDSTAKCIVADSSHRDKFKNLFSGIIILMEDYKNIRKEQIQSKKLEQVQGHDIAYLIYTSGTTGKPKGVMMSHYAMSIRLGSFAELFNLQLSDKVAQQASLSFDVSLQEILCPLVSCSTIHFIPHDVVRQPDDLIKLIECHQITFIEFIPSFLKNLLTSYTISKKIRLNKIVVGGEPLTSSLIKVFNDKLDATLINMCGPTEVCMDATYWICDDNLPRLGVPLKYTYAYILDHDLNIVPKNYPGELYFATDAMAIGYKGLPALTAEKFIANKFENTGSRLYKSGDLVRLLPNGKLDFVGRKDFQLKIRGYRVEIEEIEKVLEKYTNIKKIAVTYQTDNNTNNNYLLCYYTAIKEIDDKQIISYLEQYLPDYMIPSAFIYLVDMPININGKVDKQTLPKYELHNSKDYQAPKNKIERILCKIWQEVLGIDKVGVQDNFFRLGGDSITTLQILSKARQNSVHFKLEDLFNYPQICTLSKFCTFIKSIENIAISNKKITGIVPLTPIQSDFFSQVENYHHFNQSAVLICPEDINLNYIKKSVAALISHHDMLRVKYSILGDEVKQIIQEEINFIYKYKDLSQENDPIGALRKECNATHKEINIFIPQLIGMGIYFIGKSEGYRIFITIHHLVVDEVSWRIIVEDLEKAYMQLINKEKVCLPSKTTSFQKWSYLTKNYAANIKLEEKSFWQKLEITLNKGCYKYQLKGLPKEVIKKLDKEYTKNLLRRTNQAYKTEVRDILLAAISLAYTDWHNLLSNAQQKIIPREFIIDLEGHGREVNLTNEEVDLSRTIGWFTSIYPVDLSIEEHNNIGDLIKEIKERIRNIPNKGMGYSNLKTHGKFIKANNHTYKPNILFNFLGQKKSVQSAYNKENRVFDLSFEIRSLNIAQENQLSHKIIINCAIYNDIFSIRFTFDTKYFSYLEIESLANSYIKSLKILINYCCKENNFGYTLSDFKNIDFLTQQNIDNNLGKIKNITDVYRLSPLQEGFLFNEEMLSEEQSIGYNVQSTYKLEYNVDPNILKKAWDVVIKNNSVLRTGFIWESLPESIQFVLSDCSHNFKFKKYKILKREKILEIAAIERSKKFEFNYPPISKVLLLSDDTSKYMIWTTHHIISDGWSTGLLLKELKNIYHSLIKKTEFNCERRIEYVDYIRWIQKQNKELAIYDWKNYLNNITEDNCLEFSAKTVIEKSSSSHKDYFFHINRKTSNTLKQVAKKNDVTTNTVFQATLGIIISKYTQLTDFTLGITVSGRTIDLQNIDELIGLTINTLPLRIKLNNKENFKHFLQKLHASTTFINQTSFLSLAEIQKLFVKDVHSLFNSILVYENYPRDEINSNLNILKLKKYHNFSETEYPFTLVVYPGEQFYIRIIYSDKHFTSEFLEIFKDNFINLLEVISRIHEDQIKNVTLAQLLYLFSKKIPVKLFETNEDIKVIREERIEGLFEEKVRECRDRVAVIREGVQISYDELNKRSNKIGRYLREKHGVIREVSVGLCIERSEHIVLGILGVLKAGGCYIPMEASYPEERIRYIVEDAECKVILSNEKNVEKIRKIVGNKIEVIGIDSEEFRREVEKYKGEDIKVERGVKDLAYIIYTSGTTGKPKGVMQIHNNVARLFSITQKKYKFDHKDIWVLFHSYIFDFTVWEIWGSLLYGGKLVIVSQEKIIDTKLFFNLCKTEGITVLNQTPGAFYNFINESRSREKLSKLRYVIFGGDALNQGKLREWLNKYGYNKPRLVNMYGITETTVHATYKAIKEEDENNNNNSIGRRLGDLKIYILSKEGEVLPIGAIGEICIGGEGLARGYLNRPGLTAEKFIANPFATEEDIKRGYSRLYRTGDLGRYLSDGNIEYIGRNDEQVKIRGYRIELGEIENVMQSYEGVRQSVVVAKEREGGGDKYIVGYYVSEEELDEKEMENYLGNKLPEYMMPSKLMKIGEIVLTINGKIDKKGLPEIEFSNEEGYVAPRNDIEEKLCKIWEEVLGIDKVGIKDDFFKLGGHSIKLMQVLSMMHAQGIYVPIKYLYTNPNIRKVALYLINNNLKKQNSNETFNQLGLYNLLDSCSQNNNKNKIDTLFPITTAEEKKKLPKLFLIHPGSGLSFSYIDIEKYLSYYVYGLNNPYFFNPKRFNNVEEMAQYYLAEILKVQSEGIYYLAGYSFGGLLAYAIATIMQKRKNLKCKLILLDTAVNIAQLKGTPNEAKHSNDKLLNEKLNENNKHLSYISTKYIFEPIDSQIIFFKNKNNKGTLANLTSNCREFVMKGTHSTFLEEDIINITREMNNFSVINDEK